MPLVVAFHGTDDARVPVAAARETVARFRAAGYRAELREYRGVGHTIPPATAGDAFARMAALVRANGCGR